MRIDPENTAALVIDVQERLFPAMAGKEHFLDRSRLLIRGLHVLGVPVMVTQQYTQGLGETIPEIAGLFEGFHYAEKRAFSCCDEPAVNAWLEGLSAVQVVLCGIEAHVCVLQTAVDLKARGRNPVVVMDAVTSRSLPSLELAKERFRHEGILMTSVEALLFELLRSSAAPEFRQISALVK